jgi:hypothetical protein
MGCHPVAQASNLSDGRGLTEMAQPHRRTLADVGHSASAALAEDDEITAEDMEPSPLPLPWNPYAAPLGEPVRA